MKARTGETRSKAARTSRRRREAPAINARSERARRNAVGGGHPDTTGNIPGQNGELGNTTRPQNKRPLGKLEH